MYKKLFTTTISLFTLIALNPSNAHSTTSTTSYKELVNQEDSTTISKVSNETKEPLFRGYIGGMMLHMGYISGGTLTPEGGSEQIPINGIATGIGGRIMIGLGSHLRVGAEGYISSMNYGKNREISLGWGGLSADYGFAISKKWYCTLGGTLGGGNYTNLCSITTPTNDDTPQPTIWHSSPLFILAPYLGLEYKITSSIRAALRVDWAIAPTAKTTRADYSSGPRIYIGIMFSHIR